MKFVLHEGRISSCDVATIEQSFMNKTPVRTRIVFRNLINEGCKMWEDTVNVETTGDPFLSLNIFSIFNQRHK